MTHLDSQSSVIPRWSVIPAGIGWQSGQRSIKRPMKQDHEPRPAEMHHQNVRKSILCGVIVEGQRRWQSFEPGAQSKTVATQTTERDQFSTRDSIDLAINTHLISLITPEEIKVAMSALIP
jgi:hypothetical protein